MSFILICQIWGWYALIGASQVALMVKNPPVNGDLRDAGSIEAGNGNPPQYSCLENPMDRVAWRATIHRVVKTQTWLKRLIMHAHKYRITSTPSVTKVLYWLCQSHWLCGSQQTVENSSRDGNTRLPYLSPEKSVCRSRSKSPNRTWNNRLVPNWERSTPRLYIVTLFI